MLFSRVTFLSLHARRVIPNNTPRNTFLISQARAFTRTIPARADRKSSNNGHTAESYFKDVDSTPPPDSTVHRVDSSSEAVQRPYEPPSGEYSRAGVQTEEYRSPDEMNSPLDAGGGPENRARYGATPSYEEDEAMKMSKPQESPAEKNAGGRKPEKKA